MARDYGREALNIEQKTQDAYSVSRYISWRACAAMLLKRGYTHSQTEEILRSKITRWAADRSLSHGLATSKDLERFIDMYPNEVKELLAENLEKETNNVEHQSNQG